MLVRAYDADQAATIVDYRLAQLFTSP